MRHTLIRIAYLARTLGCLAGLCLAGAAHAQAPQDDETATSYEREFNYGINFNTNGGLLGGVAFKYAWQRSPAWYNRVSLEIVNIKHPKEFRARGAISSFIPNKVNYLFAVRPSFGQEYVLFQKAPEEGVQLNLVFGAGPTLGLLKPYYILYAEQPNDGLAVSRRYNPSLNSNNIVGAGRPLDGIDEISLLPGFHVNGGLAFESGRNRNSVFGLEGGFMLEVYTQRVPLLGFNPNAIGPNILKNPQWFNGLYLILYYGNKQ